ncbi:Pyrimidodiazepine synthase [Pseudolycoriella hygida]|uniref:Pyrimidodiazepine synthase n=1 Tax=Pseudolycoriella hygida TaxID=35572 RepID=A0A9Q0S3S7_9DIPT|nr:Pyrimidodiazepine synthase [Pseudolycoriella hygida]
MVKEVSHLKTGDPEPAFPGDGLLQLFSMRFCPYAQRVHLVLESKEIPYHTFNINLTNKPEWLTKYSPLGKVPSLGLPTENGHPFIHESLIIAEYLDEKYPQKRLNSADPLVKAFDKLLIEQFNGVISAYYKSINDSSALTDLSTGLDSFEAELMKRGTNFFGGVEPGMLDYMIWPWFERIAYLKYKGFEMDQDRFALLNEWQTGMIADPAVKVHYLPPEVYVKYWEGRSSGAVNYDMLLDCNVFVFKQMIDRGKESVCLSVYMIFDFSIRNSRLLKHFPQLSSHLSKNMVIETRHLKAGDSEPNLPNDGKLQIFSMRFCPYAQRALIVLEAKKLSYETININLSNKPEWLTKYSPLGKVPALGLPTDQGYTFIHESLVIADFLDEKYPEKPLYPNDPLAKALDRLLIERFNVVISAFHKAIRGDAEGIVQISNGLEEFEKELKKRDTKFYGGEEPGMLDYMIWPWLERLALLKLIEGNTYETDEGRFPRLVEWEKNMIADSAVSVHYLPADIHKQFAEGFILKNIEYDILVKIVSYFIDVICYD